MTATADYAALGAAIAARRQQLGRPARTVADLAGIDSHTLNHIERGQGTVAHDRLTLIADALRTSPEQLWKRAARLAGVGT